MVLEHVRDAQLFEGEAFLGVNDPATRLMQKVTAAVGDLLVRPRYLDALLCAVLRALLLAREASLFTLEPLFGAPERLERLCHSPIGRGEIVLEPKIKSGKRGVSY